MGNGERRVDLRKDSPTAQFVKVGFEPGDGKKVGETGYRKGGAAEYVKHLMEFRAVGGKAFAATPCAVEELEKD